MRPWIVALERQLELSEWLRTGDAEVLFAALVGNDDPRARKLWLDDCREIIDHANVVWIHSEMADLWCRAANDWPGQSLLPSDAPWPVGFVMLDGDVQLAGYQGVRAVAWRAIHDDDALLLWCFTPTDRRPGLIPVHCTMAPYDAAGPTLGVGLALPEGEHKVRGGGFGDDHEWDIELIRFLQTLWALLQQKLPSVREDHPPRGLRRRLARWQLTPLVKVVTLRRFRSRGTDDDGQTINETEWSHRWIVAGHWRNQWYPSLRDHRLKFINAYVKGPDDKPLLTQQKVWRFVR